MQSIVVLHVRAQLRALAPQRPRSCRLLRLFACLPDLSPIAVASGRDARPTGIVVESHSE